MFREMIFRDLFSCLVSNRNVFSDVLNVTATILAPSLVVCIPGFFIGFEWAQKWEVQRRPTSNSFLVTSLPNRRPLSTTCGNQLLTITHLNHMRVLQLPHQIQGDAKTNWRNFLLQTEKSAPSIQCEMFRKLLKINVASQFLFSKCVAVGSIPDLN